MPQPAPLIRLTAAQARAVVFAAQELAAPPGAQLVPTLMRTGLLRTLGGVEAYLAAKARVPSLRRAELDSAVERSELQVVPAVRGCIYLVGWRDVPRVLRLAESLSRGRDEREWEKVKLRRRELEKVGEAVVKVLARTGPLTTDALRKELPDGVVRSLGEAGKKVGLSSNLPPTLRLLEFEGRIERTLAGGRLDTERYLWRAARRNPFDGARLPEDPAELHGQVAEIFFRSAGLATAKQLATWSGLSQRQATEAMAKVALLPVAVEGLAGAAYALEERRELVLSGGDDSGAVAFLPFEDNVVALHDGPALFVEPEHHEIVVPRWGSAKPAKLGDARHVAMRALVADGKIAGFWEYDPDARAVVYGLFAPVSGGARERLEGKAAELTSFIAEELGHGRSYSLDTDDALRERAAFVRTLGAGKPAGTKKDSRRAC